MILKDHFWNVIYPRLILDGRKIILSNNEELGLELEKFSKLETVFISNK